MCLHGDNFHGDEARQSNILQRLYIYHQYIFKVEKKYVQGNFMLGLYKKFTKIYK